jgi:hypothetical protein
MVKLLGVTLGMGEEAVCVCLVKKESVVGDIADLRCLLGGI